MATFDPKYANFTKLQFFSDVVDEKHSVESVQGLLAELIYWALSLSTKIRRIHRLRRIHRKFSFCAGLVHPTLGDVVDGAAVSKGRRVTDCHRCDRAQPGSN